MVVSQKIKQNDSGGKHYGADNAVDFVWHGFYSVLLLKFYCKTLFYSCQQLFVKNVVYSQSSQKIVTRKRHFDVGA